MDFIIIGAGSAGCLVASQLAQKEPGKVLLIEAASPATRFKTHSSVQLSLQRSTPVRYSKLFRSQVDWNYTTEAQRHLGQRRIAWPRGKGLGGSSLINAMIYLPGARADWLQLARTWNIDPQLLRRHLPHLQSESPHTQLNWTIDSQPEIHPLSEAFLSACQASRNESRCNFLEHCDYSHGVFPRSTFFGRRVDAFQAFAAIPTTAKRLHVETNLKVRRIILEQQKAVGVEVVDGNHCRTIYAKRAIILAAGAVETPAILLRSGIGDPKSLRALDIEVVHELPAVGQHLQDHLLLPIIFGSNTPSLPANFTVSQQQQFRWSGTGPLTSNLAEVGSFSLNHANARPETEIHFTPTHYLEYPLRESPTAAFTLGLTLLQPRSTGSITLSSADAAQPPLIDPGYLSDDADMITLLDGLEAARELAATQPLAAYSSGELIPGKQKKNRQQLERAIRAWVQTVYHPVGTCRVGSAADSVVNTNFSVHGLNSLYIADAYIFRHIPACNPAAQIMTLASLASERIINGSC